MSVSYQAVGWNRQKKIYDGVLVGGVLLYLALFIGAGFALHPEATAETMIIRAFGTAALVLLHIVLSIGPLCRLDARFLPLLYNRRHLGVTMFLLGLVHGGFSMLQFHSLGDANPLVSALTSDGRYNSLSAFPFQPFGVVALFILFLMAATSHDFWLANLSAPVWKSLHMLVYVAYVLVLAHVGFGILQDESNPLFFVLWILGAVGIVGLHLAAALKESKGDAEAPANDGWVDVCAVDDIRPQRGKVVTVASERVAVFRYDGKISAMSNVCQHQNGPLGEGKVVDGFVVCPWHGFQYKPDCGASPEPFTEKIPTFEVRIVDERIEVNTQPLPPGTRVEPAIIPNDLATSGEASHGG